MKKIILLIATLVPLIVGASDFNRNKSGKFDLNGWYDIDRCTAADTLTANKDSIVWSWEVTKSDPYEVIFIIDGDSISGKDTTMVWQILGRNNTSLSWTTISSGTIAAFNDTIVEVKSHSANTFGITQANSTIAAHVLRTDTTGLAGYPADSISVPLQTITNGALTFTSTSCTYRYIGLRLSLPGDDSTGSGYLIDNVEIILRRRGL